MEHFVTLFNSLFLPQGLALHASMERHIQNYLLWILSVDDYTYDVLLQLELPNVHILRLSDFETTELLSIKKSRSIGEYCWTLTPFASRFVFEADHNVERVTYIDADLWFLRNPKEIFDEFESSSKHVLITDHAYSPEYDQSATSGQYCVQFLTFTRFGGEQVRQWWEDRCIEWCFARFENGKFGDQKYLDHWPNLFASDVHVLRNFQLALAPWNASRFPYSRAVFFHFHGLRLVSKHKVEISSHIIPSVVRKNLYLPYLRDIKNAITLLDHVGYVFIPQARPTGFIRRLFRRFKILTAKIRPFLSDIRIDL